MSRQILSVLCTLLTLRQLVTDVNCEKESSLQLLIEGKCSQMVVKNKIKGLDCQELWTKFEGVVTDKKLQSTCEMSPNQYDSLVNWLFSFVNKITKPVLWTKTKNIVDGLCRDLEMCTSVEGTLPGYILDGLDWCDTTLTGNMTYGTNCGCSRKSKFVYAFWKSVSNAYSKKISGDIQIILNGSIEKPFDATRTLGSVELPNLEYPRIQKTTVYLVHDLAKSDFRHNCSTTTIRDLKRTIEKKNIKFECQEDPRFITLFQCVKDPQNKRCALSSGSPSKQGAWNFILRIVLVSVCFYSVNKKH
ncbi:unnamed protein product [Calicophoron daubneyi]|uniref:ADP-ribosyl cyclase/cyclic ADP-ribose hydrolase n=1 Tax=Calicophoron daubneyi TaxID=300641 RepID=A0AAV2TDX3_CALDB